MRICEKSDKIFSVLSTLNPDPKTELDHTNLYTLLVAVVLSAQTTDKAVNIATKDLFARISNPNDMIILGEDNLKSYIKTIGLYNSKAKNVIKLSEIIISEYEGEVPLEFEKLIKLPGVGRKTANVVLNAWLGIEAMPVDTHVFRVSKRLGLASADNPEKVEKELLLNIEKKWLKNAHHWLVLHGRYICMARKPKCSECPIQEFCDYYQNINKII